MIVPLCLRKWLPQKIIFWAGVEILNIFLLLVSLGVFITLIVTYSQTYGEISKFSHLSQCNWEIVSLLFIMCKKFLCHSYSICLWFPVIILVYMYMSLPVYNCFMKNSSWHFWTFIKLLFGDIKPCMLLLELFSDVPVSTLKATNSESYNVSLINSNKLASVYLFK